MAKKKTNTTKKKSTTKVVKEEKIVKEEPVEEEKEEGKEKEEVIEEKERIKESKVSTKTNPLISFLGILVVISSISYLGLLLYKEYDLTSILFSLILLIFSIFFVSSTSTNINKNKSSNIFALLILLIYQILSILNIFNLLVLPQRKVMTNLVNMSLSEAMEWSTSNRITLEDTYEYSDVIDEYHIIYQDIEPGTKLKGISTVNIIVSEGPNPNKEIVIPNMLTWNLDKVLEFIDKNHLTNVEVEFVKSDEDINSLIEQSVTGNMKRNDLLELTFSYGDERDYKEVTLKDLTNLSKFKAEVYLKQHGIKYDISYDFSEDIPKDFVVRTEPTSGTKVILADDTVKLVLSTGKKITVPDLTKMSSSELTDWIIKNNLKIKYKESYNDNIKNGNVISANYKEGDSISEGTLVEVVISKGQLKMPSVNNYSEFREWAEEYDVDYEEQHEFSDNVKIGEVISYSYKPGEVIKNNDSIIVVISDGKKISVPNVVGLTKDNATSKLKGLGFKCSYIYKSSNSVASGKVIRQSISAGSSVSMNTTITLTVSTGKASSGGGSSSPSCDKSDTVTAYLQPGNTGSQTCKMIKNGNPSIKFSCTYVKKCSNGDTNSGTVCNSNSFDGKKLNKCDTYVLQIVE